jgi:hypothetical protein
MTHAMIWWILCSVLAGAEADSLRKSAGPRASTPARKSWIYFRDKGFTSDAERDRALVELRRTFNPRTIARRAKRGSTAAGGRQLIDERDVPIHRRYLAEVERAGARLVHESRWLNAASVRATSEQLAEIARLPFVTRTEPVRGARRHEPDPPPSGVSVAAAPDPFYALSHFQLEVMNLVALHQRGFTGDGVVIGVLDTGFDRTHLAFNEPGHPIDVLAEYDFVADDPDAGFEEGDPSFQHRHGTWVLGTLAAYKPGELIGGAFDASYILCKTEDATQEVPIEEDNFVAGLEFIEQNGGDIATSSLGYPDFYDYQDLDGLTAVTTQGINIATELGLICLTAAGNGGQNVNTPTLIPPGDALDVITVGAVEPAGGLAIFSANGPTADGRLKPEVLALGDGVASVSTDDTAAYEVSLLGTSFSTPLTAAAVACILQAHPDWTVAQFRQNLFETAAEFVLNGEPDPASNRGYGLINASAAAQDCDDNGRADLIDIRLGAADVDDNQVPDVCEIADWDQDGDVDAEDFFNFTQCMAGPAGTPDLDPPAVTACVRAFGGDDEDIDLADYSLLLPLFTSPQD